MNNKIRDKCMNYCTYVTQISGVNATIIDIETREFTCDYLGSQEKCFQTYNCNAYNTHLYGAIESERWDGKYTYYCPCGFIFIATSINDGQDYSNGAVIAGPIIMSNDEEVNIENGLQSVAGIPVLTTAQTRSLSEVIRAIVGYITKNNANTFDIDSGMHADLLNSMYEVSGKIRDRSLMASYPLELEKELLHYVALGDKEASSDIINKILGHIYFTNNGDFEAIRARTLELLVILSRSTIDSGADANEVFWLSSNFIKRVNEFSDLEQLSKFITVVIHKFISSTFDFTNIKHKDVMFKITEYIKANFSQKITLDELSEHVYLSKSYLSRLLKEELKCTFTEYVNKIRIEKSKILLMKNEIPIVDIAYAVGFDDQSYFTKVFKKVTNTSPGKYREGRHKD